MLGGKSVLAGIEQMGLQSKDGYVRFTNDPFLIDQVVAKDRSQIPKNSYLYSEKKKAVKLQQTFWVEYQDQSRTQDHFCYNTAEGQEILKDPFTKNDIVLIPISIDFIIDLDVQDNGEYVFPTLKMESKMFSPHLYPCQHIYNIHNLGMPADAKSKNNNVGDEDFDDEDDMFDNM
jgi:hypothetical protein